MAVIVLCGFVPLAFVSARYYQTPTPLAWDHEGCIWGPDYGVAPGPDCSTALQNLIAQMAASAGGVKGGGFSGAKIRLAPGITNASASWDVLPAVRIVGAGSLGGQAASVLTSADPVGTVRRGTSGGIGTVPVEIRDVQITNSNNASSATAPADAVSITGIYLGSIDRCFFSTRAGRGWYSGRVGNPPLPNTSVHFVDCGFINCKTAGVQGWMRVQFDNCVYTGCGVGQDISGTVVGNLQRFEENNVGLQTGLLSSCNGVWNAGTFEANGLHQSVLKNSSNCIFNQFSVLGDRFGGTGFATCGIMSYGQNCTWNSASVGGNFTTATISLQPNAGQQFFTQTQAGNAQPGVPVWQNLMVNPGNLYTIQTPVQ
jgi:hypothetical protein